MTRLKGLFQYSHRGWVSLIVALLCYWGARRVTIMVDPFAYRSGESVDKLITVSIHYN